MLDRYVQIVYVPNHAQGNTMHPDCERGFVTSVKPELGIAFCRYWSKLEAGALRTLANSEATPIGNLVEQDSVPQRLVDLWLDKLP